MAREKPASPMVKAFGDHQVIMPPNPLRHLLSNVSEKDFDDPIARAEKALDALSGEFNDWMASECDRLAAAHADILKNGFSAAAQHELFRAAHDIKGSAATFGYPTAAAAAATPGPPTPAAGERPPPPQMMPGISSISEVSSTGARRFGTGCPSSPWTGYH